MVDKRAEGVTRFRSVSGNKHHGEGKHFLPGIGHPRFNAIQPTLLIASAPPALSIAPTGLTKWVAQPAPR